MLVVTGQLVCATEGQAALVRRYLPDHIALTRAEPGCLRFEVTPAPGGLVWELDEAFTDAAAFATHQARTKTSEWGRQTVGIERRFETRET